MQQNEDFINRISKNIERNRERVKNDNMTEIQKKSEPDSESGTLETKSSSSLKSELVETETIRSEASLVPYTPSLEAISATVISIDSSVRDLQSYMRGMFANQPEPTIMKYDVDRVQTAVVCARTMAEMMKVKLEAIKLGREIINEQK